MTKIKEYLIRNYFKSTYPIEYRIYMIFFIQSFIISIVNAIEDALLGRAILGITSQWLYNIINIVFLLISPQLRLKLIKPHLLLLAFGYVPFSFFQTGGYDGTILILAQMVIFLLAVVFTGKTRAILVILNILQYIACILIQYHYPALVAQQGSLKMKVVGIIRVVVMSFGGLAVATAFIRTAYYRNRSELIELSNKDALTGAYNRRYLENYLNYKLTEERRRHKIFLIMIDLDHFKRVNDNYGHHVGDEVLREFVTCLKKELRGEDVLARYGGEEFMIVLQGVWEDEAYLITERLRKVIEKGSFSQNIKITSSVGLTKVEKKDTIDTLFTRVDQLLYQAKEEGRNRTITDVRNLKESRTKDDSR